jgi:lysyl-tRNA synthetase class 1
MGDAVRAYGIALALKNLGIDAQLIAYSDDMDGLRKVPNGLPDWLEQYIAKPVSSIPDPFGECHPSYGSHMSSLLLDGLDQLGVRYQFQSGSDAYKKGMLINQIDTILKNSSVLGKKIAEIVGQEKYVDILPYFPVCQSCGRLYVAKAERYYSSEKRVAYSCTGSKIGKKEIKGCGYSGEADIRRGEGKLAWKVEFAARWQAFDIRFEAYGKDIMDSVRVNDWVSDQILRFSHPLHVKYEMFLDKGGKKISKSSGNVLTPQMWLRYGTPQSLLLLLFKRITGTRHVGLDDVPSLMDEYDQYEDVYFGKVKESNNAKRIKMNGIYQYINHLVTPLAAPLHVPYRVLVQQASLFSDINDIDKILARLSKYYNVDDKTETITTKISLALNWAHDHKDLVEVFDISLTSEEKVMVNEFIQELTSFKGQETVPDAPKLLQSKIYDIARSHGVQPKDFFVLLYKMLLNTDKGPRIGNYLLDMGLEKAAQTMRHYA